jgi:hypothetical protein
MFLSRQITVFHKPSGKLLETYPERFTAVTTAEAVSNMYVLVLSDSVVNTYLIKVNLCFLFIYFLNWGNFSFTLILEYFCLARCPPKEISQFNHFHTHYVMQQNVENPTGGEYLQLPTEESDMFLPL